MTSMEDNREGIQIPETTMPKLWVVAILSIFSPGFGQLYIGKPLRGLVFFFITFALGNAFVAVVVFVDVAPQNIILGVAILGLMFFVPLIDAIKTARKSTDFSQRPNWIKKWPILIIVVLSFNFLASFGIPVWGNYESFVTPSVSMEDALFKGDYSIAETGGGITIQDGGIVIFVYPLDTRVKYVKRLVGLPGDTIQFIDKLL